MKQPAWNPCSWCLRVGTQKLLMCIRVVIFGPPTKKMVHNQQKWPKKHEIPRTPSDFAWVWPIPTISYICKPHVAPPCCAIFQAAAAERRLVRLRRELKMELEDQSEVRDGELGDTILMLCHVKTWACGTKNADDTKQPIMWHAILYMGIIWYNNNDRTLFLNDL